jgi:multidrug efflux pump subunit AcrA (membrane-fusion protein)
MLPSALLRGRKAVLLRRGVPIALGGLVITGAGVAYADHGDSGPAYRTASASVGEVDQLVTLTGTVTQLTQQDASFGVSGTVKKVQVAAGDKVSAGDTLATLDTTGLQAAVTAAKATLAKANAQLETDEAADDSTSTSSASPSATASAAPSTGSGTTPGTGTGRTGSGVTGTTAGGIDLAGPTKAVVTALATASTDLKKVTAAITARDAACDSVLTGTGTTTPDATASASPTDDPSAQPTATPAVAGSTPTTVDLQSCIDAMTAVNDLQSHVATDQAAVQSTQNALSVAMDKAVAAIAAQATTTASTATSATSGAADTTSANTGGGRQAVNAVDQAAQIAVDNASVLAAQAALDSANEDLNEAVLTAPIDGVVGTVGITKGSTAATSNTITILGNGAVTVTLNVPQATAAKLKKGMAANVTADGASAPSDGTVDSIGVMPSTSNGSSTYPVVLVVNNPADGLAEGAAATVAITVKAVDNAVTVPNSAVTSTGTGATGYVTLLQNGKAVRQTVTTGAVGTTLTQIVSGVTMGQTVVLADASADVPATSATANTGGGNFTGGANLPVGGFPGGGTGNGPRN